MTVLYKPTELQGKFCHNRMVLFSAPRLRTAEPVKLPSSVSAPAPEPSLAPAPLTVRVPPVMEVGATVMTLEASAGAGITASVPVAVAVALDEGSFESVSVML